LWCFVNLLSDLVTVLTDRGPPLLMFAASIPMFVCGVTFTLLLDKLRCVLAGRSVLRYWPPILIALLGFSLAQAFVDIFSTRWVALAIYAPWQEWALEISSQRVLTITSIYLWVFSFAFALLWAGSVSDLARYNATKATAMEAAAFRAEATALRFQLNPHFLFNTLNSIAGTVVAGSRRDAEGMILKLANFLRASLASDPSRKVPLEDEVAAMEAYLDIEKVRFGERMEVEIDIDEEAEDACVPHFILQPLVENAVKHGVARTSRVVCLVISGKRRQDRLLLRVTNLAVPSDLGPASAGASLSADNLASTRVGLDNIRQRLALVYDDAVLRTHALPGGFSAEIDLPFEFARADLAMEEKPLLRAVG